MPRNKIQQAGTIPMDPVPCIRLSYRGKMRWYHQDQDPGLSPGAVHMARVASVSIWIYIKGLLGLRNSTYLSLKYVCVRS